MPPDNESPADGTAAEPTTAGTAAPAADPAGAAAADTETAKTPPATVGSESDERTVNNVMRHAYRVLSDDEKKLMLAIKDKGKELHDLLESAGISRELALAKTKVEEAVMWGVKHITA